MIRLACCAALFAFAAKAAPTDSQTGIRLLDQFGHPRPVNQKSTLTTVSRCGVEDSVEFRSNGRSKRFVFFDNKWDRKDLTYGIDRYSSHLDPAAVDEVIEKAFGIWAEYANLNFKQTSGDEADIKIGFFTGEHFDGIGFDGPRKPRGDNKLAHAFQPGDEYDVLGDVHFDDDEYWTVEQSSGHYGTDLLQIAVHEIGHALGLKHSRVDGAIMNEFYNPYMAVVELGEDDIAGIQTLYGKKGGDEYPDICGASKIDTIFSSSDGYVYVFKGKHYWRLTDDGIAASYPKLIATKWKGLPDDIDAALTYDGLTYFFKGPGFWVYDGGERVNSSPPGIQKAFAGIPDDIDTAMVWNGDGKMYFFKGKLYWRVDPAKKRRYNLPYRKRISNWKGLPSDLDAAFALDGKTYFLKGDDLYKFDDEMFSVDPASPYKIRSKLFGCPSQSGETQSSWWDVIFS